MNRRILTFLLLLTIVALTGAGCAKGYHTFADYPGMTEYYRDRCQVPPTPLPEKDLELLEKHRPRFILPPGGSYPIDFYRDYVPYTVMRSWPDRKIAAVDVNHGLLLKHRSNRKRYLDLDLAQFRADGRDLKWIPGSPPLSLERAPVVYGRSYRERVPFPDGEGGYEEHDLIFLKYHLLFAY